MRNKILLTLGICLVAVSCFAAIEWRRFDSFNNTGGLNDSFSPIAIEDNEASGLQNVVFTTSGSFKTRDGFDFLNATTLGAISCTGISYYEPTSGTKYLIAVFDDDTIRKMDYAIGGGPDGTWDNITGSLTFTATQNTLASFTVGEDTLIIEDGDNTTAPYKWTGSGNASALGGSPPNATMVAYHKNMAFAAGNNTYPSTLYFTDVGNIEDWATGLSGNVSVETNDGSQIRAIMPGFDSLYIWKDNSIWRLSGDDKDNFVLQRMISDTGTMSQQCVARIGNDFIFMSSQGDVYLYDGAIKLQLVSLKVDGTLGEANFSRFKYAVGVIYDTDYYLSISSASSSTHDILLVLDTFGLAWTKFTGMNINAIAVADNGLGEDMLVFGDYRGFVNEYPSGTSDAGSAISAYYITKQYRFPEIAPLKDWKLLRVFATQKGDYSVTTEMRNDFISTGKTESVSLLGESSLYGTAIYGVDRYGGQNLVIGRIEPNLEGDFFQIKFSNSNIDEPIEIKGWSIYLDESDRI